MNQCINQRCRRTIDDSWAFCSICGTDNRPPKGRAPVLVCTHQYFHGTTYCVNCGLPMSLATSLQQTVSIYPTGGSFQRLAGSFKRGPNQAFVIDQILGTLWLIGAVVALTLLPVEIKAGRWSLSHWSTYLLGTCMLAYTASTIGLVLSRMWAHAGLVILGILFTGLILAVKLVLDTSPISEADLHLLEGALYPVLAQTVYCALRLFSAFGPRVA